MGWGQGEDHTLIFRTVTAGTNGFPEEIKYRISCGMPVWFVHHLYSATTCYNVQQQSQLSRMLALSHRQFRAWYARTICWVFPIRLKLKELFRDPQRNGNYSTSDSADRVRKGHNLGRELLRGEMLFASEGTWQVWLRREPEKAGLEELALQGHFVLLNL